MIKERDLYPLIVRLFISAVNNFIKYQFFKL